MTTVDEHIGNALTHVRVDVEALHELDAAILALTAAFDAVEPVRVGVAEHEDEIAAVTTFAKIARARLRERANSEAARVAFLVSREVIEATRSRSEHEAIQWLTGNAYFPPLRSLPEAERIWETNDADAWEAFVETFERALDDASIYMACPEYDNAIYLVDMGVWEPVPEDERTDDDTLSGEWRRIARDESIGELGQWRNDA